ncbi:MAG: ABC transporter ATP-binding protein [Acidimicrobiia bacterium]
MSNGTSGRSAVVVNDVTVTFRPMIDRKPTLRKSLGRLRHREKETLVALDDVSLTIDKGEAFGVIGSNGAGKSTLLKVMAKTLKPSSGTVNVFGKTSTLLSLGLGMKPDLSGRRNVYLGGLAAGLRKAEIDEKFDSIVAYANIGEAIDRPVKTYSSGMFSRLAFSVAMAIEPNIMLLDEVLAVGDEAFREKSLQTMKDLLDNAGTIIFVSHTLPNVVEFCDRAMWLDGGVVQSIGPSEPVVEQYKADVARRKAAGIR